MVKNSKNILYAQEIQTFSLRICFVFGKISILSKYVLLDVGM